MKRNILKVKKLETGLEPLITGFKGVCINIQPQIIQFPPVFEA